MAKDPTVRCQARRKKSRKSLLVALAISALFYVVAGSYFDLPPRGIALASTTTHLRVQDTSVGVQARLTYVCTSWRTRRTDVYLPFSTALGARTPRDLTAEVAAPSSYHLYPDGVILSLVMSPGSRQTATFRFTQDAPTRAVRYYFGIPRGWDFPPELETVEVETAAACVLKSSVAVARGVTRDGVAVRMLAMKGGEGVDLLWR